MNIKTDTKNIILYSALKEGNKDLSITYWFKQKSKNSGSENKIFSSIKYDGRKYFIFYKFRRIHLALLKNNLKNKRRKKVIFYMQVQ